MATLSTTQPTLLDLARRTAPDGSISAIAEILNETNEVLDEMVFMEGNLPTGHRATVRTGLPVPTWRKIGGGVQPTKSSTAQIMFTTGMLEAFAEVDVRIADLNGNTAEFRLSEAIPHLEGINIELADTLFFGNETTEPEAFTGLSPHYNDLSAESGDNILDALGTGSDNASIWLIVWSDQTIHGIVPKGSTAGLRRKDMGEVVIEDQDGSGGRMLAYREHFALDAGLVVKDWRFGVRIANIDKSDLTNVFTSGAFSTGADLPDLMFQAMRLVPNLARGRASFYMARDLASWVARQSIAKGAGGAVTADQPSSDASAVGGQQRYTERFHGIPMRRVDALAADEAQVT